MRQRTRMIILGSAALIPWATLLVLYLQSRGDPDVFLSSQLVMMAVVVVLVPITVPIALGLGRRWQRILGIGLANNYLIMCLIGTLVIVIHDLSV